MVCLGVPHGILSCLVAQRSVRAQQDITCSVRRSPFVPEVAFTGASLLRTVGLVLEVASEDCISSI